MQIIKPNPFHTQRNKRRTAIGPGIGKEAVWEHKLINDKLKHRFDLFQRESKGIWIENQIPDLI
ncbi:CLUMA_CG009496, isoform A [Clunio marinus]|uniref:CLUMA_CG009496, isoform A n=1 Tax=Clunio marinus TaxID=568069 RepID=A0A1J1I7B1_9DIPT|nr:CLUMA_CG009496, isoform A [Clunio marinus]